MSSAVHEPKLVLTQNPLFLCSECAFHEVRLTVDQYGSLHRMPYLYESKRVTMSQHGPSSPFMACRTLMSFRL